jgi:hypothetical protein
MKSSVLLLCSVLGGQLGAAAPEPPQTGRELQEARRIGWELAMEIVEAMEAGERRGFPGIEAWLKDAHKVAKGNGPKPLAEPWLLLDGDALVTRNPHYWQAYYEIAPGDPGLALLHAGLLLASGEATRASQLVVIAKQQPGIPREVQTVLGLRRLIVPDAAPADSAEEPKVVQLNQLRLYVPGPDLPKRVADINPLANYIKALEAEAAKFLEKEPLPKAKGLLIAVGIKPDKRARVWCQSIEGDIPDALLRRLEQKLGNIETITVKGGAMAFTMELKVRDQKVTAFPEFPTVWLEAAKKSKTKLLVPPDELFQVIWAD